MLSGQILRALPTIWNVPALYNLFLSSFSFPNSLIAPPCLPIITFAKVALAMPRPLSKSTSAFEAIHR